MSNGLRRFEPLATTPEGRVMEHYGRFYKEAVNIAYHAIGGQDRFNDVADADPKWFYEKFIKQQIPKEVQLNAGPSIDDLIKQLDSNTIDITPKETADAPEYVRVPEAD